MRHEHEALRGLGGPWIPAVRALDTRRGRLRLVLAGAPGRLLSHQPARPMGPAAFLDLAVSLTEAVADMHRQGVVHGDLTPENVLVDPSTSAVTLLGFGTPTRAVAGSGRAPRHPGGQFLGDTPRSGIRPGMDVRVVEGLLP